MSLLKVFFPPGCCPFSASFSGGAACCPVCVPASFPILADASGAADFPERLSDVSPANETAVPKIKKIAANNRGFHRMLHNLFMCNNRNRCWFLH